MSDKDFTSDISSLSWMGTTASEVLNRMLVLLTPAYGVWFSSHNLPLPGHVLIHGPPVSGKTLLVITVGKCLEEHEDLLAHIVYVCCCQLAMEKSLNIRQALSSYISEALDHAPSVVILGFILFRLRRISTSITEFLTDILDEYLEKRKISCGIGPLAFIASTKSLESIPLSLCSSGLTFTCNACSCCLRTCSHFEA